MGRRGVGVVARGKCRLTSWLLRLSYLLNGLTVEGEYRIATQLALDMLSCKLGSLCFVFLIYIGFLFGLSCRSCAWSTFVTWGVAAIVRECALWFIWGGFSDWDYAGGIDILEPADTLLRWRRLWSPWFVGGCIWMEPVFALINILSYMSYILLVQFLDVRALFQIVYPLLQSWLNQKTKHI